jgi:uncharacterized protein with GYD domain
LPSDSHTPRLARATLGRYDTVVVFEAANEKEAMKFAMSVAEFVSTETLVAIPRQEAISML